MRGDRGEQMSIGLRIVSYYRFVRRIAVFLLFVPPAAFLLIHLLGLVDVNSHLSWHFWFIRDEYKYVYQTYAINDDTSRLFREYDLTTSVLFVFLILYVLFVTILIVSTRYWDQDAIYGTAIIRNLQIRARNGNMWQVYWLLIRFFVVLAVAVAPVIFFNTPDIADPMLRLWAENSMLSFVSMQVFMMAAVLLLASEWFVMGILVLVSLLQRHG
jgi:hypothetical protein